MKSCVQHSKLLNSSWLTYAILKTSLLATTWQWIVRFSRNFVRWRDIRQRSRSNATNVKLWKFKLVDDRHLNKSQLAIFSLIQSDFGEI